MSNQFLGEVQAITSTDNKSLVLSGDFRLLAFAGYGSAEVQWQTRQGYRQTGQTVIGYSVQPRGISITITTEQQISREDFWRNRSLLLEYFRPNRGTDDRGNELTLTLIMANGTRRAIKAYYNGGLELDGDEDNNFIINGSISLTCFNPIWYDPYAISVTPEPSSDVDLVFPIEFPIEFGLDGLAFITDDLAYEGTWRSYPKITLVGPYSSATLENTATGIAFQLGVAISEGESRIIELSEEGFSIVDQNGTSKFNELVSGANLVGFNIRPASELAVGTEQTLKTILVNGSEGISSTTYEYHNRYWGI